MAVAIFKKWESFLRNFHDDQIMRKVIQPTVHMIWLNPGILSAIRKHLYSSLTLANGQSVR